LGAGAADFLFFLSTTTVVVDTSTVKVLLCELVSLKVKIHWPAPCAVTVTVTLGPVPEVGAIDATLPDVFPLPSEQELEESVNVPV
jgi:hypothetical protein